jgi:uncharacterized protein YlxW (UPF0749 family)
LKSECEAAQKKCLDMAEMAEASAQVIQSTNDMAQAKHTEELESIKKEFQEKENDLVSQIKQLQDSVEELKNRHAEEVAKLTNQIQEVCISRYSAIGI